MGLKQKFSPNVAQTSEIRGKYVTMQNLQKKKHNNKLLADAF
jgi:hypothetical protein